MEFLVHGIRDYGEPGVFMAFEETMEDLTENVASLGFDLGEMCRRKQLAMDYVYIERSEIEETGAYNLEGLCILKSRGMAHSNQVRESLLTDHGIHLKDVTVGPGTVLTGSARTAQEVRDKAQEITHARHRRDLEQALAKAQLDAVRIKTAALDEELKMLTNEERAELACARGGDLKK